MANGQSVGRWVLIFGLVASAIGCTAHPAGERQEREAALQAGKLFEKHLEARMLPRLPVNPTPDQLVDYALLANAELEQHYWEWRAAIEQIPQDGTQSSTLNVGLGTAITHGHASWGSTTVSLSNDPMTDIKWPAKLDAAAKQSLGNAKAAGRRFVQAKYELREKVLNAYYDYALNAELIRLEQGNERLLETIATVTQAQSRAGGSGQQDVLTAKNEIDMSRNDVANMEAQLPSQRAGINALLSRPVDAPLALPLELPPSRPLAYSDQQLMGLAAKQNPELLALSDEIHGRIEGIRLARLQYVPDFNFSAGTDLMGITQSLLGQATIPVFRYEAINAAIAQAEANLNYSQAMRRQTHNDLNAQIIMDIMTVRDADRQLDLFEHLVLPRTRQAIAITRSVYEAGQSSLLVLLDSQHSLIAIERLIANLRIVRERHLAHLEVIVGERLSIPPSPAANAKNAGSKMFIPAS